MKVLSQEILKSCQVSLLRGFHPKSPLETVECPSSLWAGKRELYQYRQPPGQRNGCEWGKRKAARDITLQVLYPHTCHSRSVSWDCTWHLTCCQQGRQRHRLSSRETMTHEKEREGVGAEARWMTDNRLIGRGRCNGVWSGRPQETVRETVCLSATSSLSLTEALAVCHTHTSSTHTEVHTHI